MSKLLQKVMSNTTSKMTTSFGDSEFFKDRKETPTDMPILNLALSGRLDGGFRSGLIQLAGPSKHFKSNLGLIMVAAYLKQRPDAVCLMYDTEFGSPPEYLASAGVDVNRVVHTPLLHVEQFRFDLIKQLDNLDRSDDVIIFVDSIGNMASKKEVEDALNEKSAADMTRAKQLKSVFRAATPYLTMRDIPLIGINHTYMEQSLFTKAVVSGGTGAQYSSNEIFIIGKAKEKVGTELKGFKFTINIEKSRTVREGIKFPFSVSFEDGIDKWSGLMEFALHTGHVVKPKNGWYTRPSVEGDKNWRMADTSCKEFWEPLINGKFADDVHKMVALGSKNLMGDEIESIEELSGEEDE